MQEGAAREVLSDDVEIVLRETRRLHDLLSGGVLGLVLCSSLEKKEKTKKKIKKRKRKRRKKKSKRKRERR
ncbi:hypothetical protein E2C01_075584 [Portunus trituberculatus]|uniref:Uncharacterized protein n=1 Tax=Portunus trituberculatus TaxID=210409 RepID=A0A5B7IKL1_PORTR|nr:hypothetical protein [Portunus trituberculatus]